MRYSVWIGLILLCSGCQVFVHIPNASENTRESTSDIVSRDASEQHTEQAHEALQEGTEVKEFHRDKTKKEEVCYVNDERCNGVDDDCDGQIDEDIPDRPCSVTIQPKICRQPYRACVRGQFSECSNVGIPLSPSCHSNEDLDCDGKSDDAVFGRQTPELRVTYEDTSKDILTLSILARKRYRSRNFYLTLMNIEGCKRLSLIETDKEKVLSRTLLDQDCSISVKLDPRMTFVGKLYIDTQNTLVTGYCGLSGHTFTNQICRIYRYSIDTRSVRSLQIPTSFHPTLKRKYEWVNFAYYPQHKEFVVKLQNVEDYHRDHKVPAMNRLAYIRINAHFSIEYVQMLTKEKPLQLIHLEWSANGRYIYAQKLVQPGKLTWLILTRQKNGSFFEKTLSIQPRTPNENIYIQYFRFSKGEQIFSTKDQISTLVWVIEKEKKRSIMELTLHLDTGKSQMRMLHSATKSMFDNVITGCKDV